MKSAMHHRQAGQPNIRPPRISCSRDALQGREWQGSSRILLKDCPAESQGLSADACFQCSVVSRYRAAQRLPIQARLQVAADRRVGILKRQAAKAHRCQDPPEPQGSHLKRSQTLF